MKILILTVLILLCLYVLTNVTSREKKCEQKGGVLLRGQWGLVCVKKEVVIEL
jgi:hypothetical protein